jgi:hypothetical protein
MKFNGINFYIVSLVFLITAISMNSLQYQKNPFWYQSKNKEKEDDYNYIGATHNTKNTDGNVVTVTFYDITAILMYKPTILDSFYSIIGIDGFYKNGVWLQIIYILITFILYIFVEGVFGSFISIIIFVVVMLSNYWYTWNLQPNMCNNVKFDDSNKSLFNEVITYNTNNNNNTDTYNISLDNYNKYMFSNMANLSTVLLSMVILILYSMSKYQSLKSTILVLYILTFVGVCIYDYSLLNRSQLDQLTLENKVCNSTTLHGFYYIEGALLFFIFSMFKIPEINLKNYKIKI